MRYSLIQIIFCLVVTVAQGQEKAPANPISDARVEYICPMYCTDDVSSTPAKCRICGMRMELRSVVENPKEYKILRPEEALDRMKKDRSVVLLDVRSTEEYDDSLGHLENSVLIPIKELEERVNELAQYKDKTIIAYCSHGIRSASAAKFLTKKGFTVFSLMGGLTKWNREHLPLLRK